VDLCNCAALRKATRHVTKFYDAELAPVGLGVNQYSILMHLRRLGSCSISDLARHLVMDRSTLGHLLKPLEAKGWVALAEDAVDRRSRRLALSEGGWQLLRSARPLWEAAQRRFEDQFGAEESLALRRLMGRVAHCDFSTPSPESDVGSEGVRP